jgi:sec-independent protein translocase protein TatA
MFDIGLPELVLILVIALLVFGPGKMVEVSRGLGKGIRDFRRATSDVTKEFSDAFSLDEPEKPTPAPAPDVEPSQSSPLAAPEAPQPGVEPPASEPPPAASSEPAPAKEAAEVTAPVEPAPGESTPVEPAPVETALVEPAPVEAAPVEPTLPPVTTEPPRSSMVEPESGVS